MNRPNRGYHANNYGNRPHLPYRHHPYMSRPNFTPEPIFPTDSSYLNRFQQPILDHSYEISRSYGYNQEVNTFLTQSLYPNIPPPPASTANQTSNLNTHSQLPSNVTDIPEQSNSLPSYSTFSNPNYYSHPSEETPTMDESNVQNNQVLSNTDANSQKTLNAETKSSYVVVPVKRPLPVTLDPTLPPEVAKLMENGLCRLCSVKLNSRVQAKTHYEGKPHAKKLKSSVELFQQHGKVNANEQTPTKKKRISIEDASQLYCKCCDLSFTSTEHAKQHYLGRNHHRVLNGLKPLKTGYYNKTTEKWQRMPPDPTVSAQMLNTDESSIDESVLGKGKFFCDICGVSATSKDQFADHLKGVRHKKTSQSAAPVEEVVQKKSKDSILASVIKPDRTKVVKTQDYSIYRTPSGNFYCAPCDLTLNSEVQFEKHVDSKKHKFKKK